MDATEVMEGVAAMAAEEMAVAASDGVVPDGSSAVIPALPPVAGLLAAVAPLSAEARAYALEASSENTRRAYRAAWQDFTAWCATEGREALPAAPETVGTFLAARASTHKAASLSMRLVAIGQAHRLKGHRLDTGHPAIRETMKGIRRTHGTAPAKKDAAVSNVIRDAVGVLSKRPGPRALRDRALLLVGFAAALRRSELVALDAADIQAGAIFRSVSRHSALRAARLSDRDVARVVKATLAAAGYNPATYSRHSLRSGFITTAAREGVAERHIQNQSRHKSLPVLRGYIRRGSLFVDNAAAWVGL